MGCEYSNIQLEDNFVSKLPTIDQVFDAKDSKELLMILTNLRENYANFLTYKSQKRGVNKIYEPEIPSMDTDNIRVGRNCGELSTTGIKNTTFGSNENFVEDNNTSRSTMDNLRRCILKESREFEKDYGWFIHPLNEDP